MRSLQHPFLQLNLLDFSHYKFAILCFCSAFVVTLLAIPPLISLINRFKFFDLPNERKEHLMPIPTMGGVAIFAGMMVSLLLWFPFSFEIGQIAFFFSLIAFFALGIMDDLKDLSARYKFMVQLGLATLIAVAGIRINSFGGFLGILELPLLGQYSFTILAIVGITNAFNLIDGIDGLAGELGFVSIIMLGLLLIVSNDSNTALAAFALGGSILAFLYFNLNPARIFMGDTGSLVLGFVIAVLSIRLVQINNTSITASVTHAPIFALGIVFIPLFDTIRVFSIRIWKGGSPFMADKTHIHHLLTKQGFNHHFVSRFICVLHLIVLSIVYSFRNLPQEWTLLILVAFMLIVLLLIKKLRIIVNKLNEIFAPLHKIVSN